MAKFLKINVADNVAVAIEPLSAGEVVNVDGVEFKLKNDIPAGHKFLLTNLKEGEDVIKYGYPIGHLREDHEQGEFINDANIKTNLSGLLDYSYSPVFTAADITSMADAKVDYDAEDIPTTFKGYRRKNGEIGIRNELWIVPTVGCVDGIVNQLCQRLKAEVGLPEGVEHYGTSGVERIVAFPHNYGCSQLSGDHENTRKVLRDLFLHPNAGAVLVVGLGCENNQPDKFKELLGDYDETRIRFMVSQKVEGDEVEEGMKILRELYAIASKDQRTEIPLSELRVGLKCGGSDGFSGITANPLLGVFSDFIVSQGGTTVLTEVPEMFGAETILMNRCESEEVFEKTVHLINDFKQYFEEHHQTIYENPSPGNKAGGISTLEDKALGCTQKSGFSPVADVLPYSKQVSVHGLNLLSAPGNDLVAATALAASGAHLVLFSTGRGTPFACPVPTVKISSNTPLAEKKSGWIDFNAGRLLSEQMSLQDLSSELLELVLEVASGKPVKSESNGFHDLAIFKSGVTL